MGRVPTASEEHHTLPLAIQKQIPSGDCCEHLHVVRLVVACTHPLPGRLYPITGCWSCCERLPSPYSRKASRCLREGRWHFLLAIPSHLHWLAIPPEQWWYWCASRRKFTNLERSRENLTSVLVQILWGPVMQYSDRGMH